MSHIQFETLGNAIVQVYEDGRPILVTDPWLVGTCYFGSWAHDLPPTQSQIDRAIASDYVWISHGHPDHLHPESLALFPKSTKILLADHYNPEIADDLRAEGFDVTVLKYREWFHVGATVEVLTVDNENQDSILVIRTPDALIVNANDSPYNGEFSFLKKLVNETPSNKTFLLALCSIEADMVNFVDAAGTPVPRDVTTNKRYMIESRAQMAERMGVQHFCCSSSQHLYVRQDSIWANDLRISWQDMQAHWYSDQVRLVEPYVTVDLDTLDIVPNHPSHETDLSRITQQTGDDDWADRLTAAEWEQVWGFLRRIETLKGVADFISFTVGGEKRTFYPTGEKGLPRSDRQKGVHFMIPRQSLMDAVSSGYFDDLLIGNFMKTELVNMKLYPDFSPRLTKFGGGAKVRTHAGMRRMWWRYFRRNPLAYLGWRMGMWRKDRLVPTVREFADKIGLKSTMRRAYRRVFSEPL